LIVNALVWLLPMLLGTLQHGGVPSKVAPAPAFHETLIRLPGISSTRLAASMLFSFGDARVDSQRSLYLLADQSSGALDVIDIRRSAVVRQIAAGPCLRCRFSGVDGHQWSSRSGPSAVALVDGTSQAWVGDVGSVELVDYVLGTIVRSIEIDAPNGMPSIFRTAHACYDSGDHLLMLVNPDDPMPFLSIVDTRSGKHVRQVTFPHALGLGECAYRRADRRFYFTIAGLPKEPEGALASIRNDGLASKTPTITIFTKPQCSPSALAMDRDQAHLLIGCAALDSPLPTYDHAQHRVPMKTIVFDLGAKRFSREIDEVGAAQSIGIDERRGRWYVAAPGMTDTGYPDGNVTPVLGIVDAKRGRWLENVPMAEPAHSVAVDSASGRIFMPIRQSPTSDGGILVLTPTN
jgi:hypothetical protein